MRQALEAPRRAAAAAAASAACTGNPGRFSRWIGSTSVVDSLGGGIVVRPAGVDGVGSWRGGRRHRRRRRCCGWFVRRRSLLLLEGDGGGGRRVAEPHHVGCDLRALRELVVGIREGRFGIAAAGPVNAPLALKALFPQHGVPGGFLDPLAPGETLPRSSLEAAEAAPIVIVVLRITVVVVGIGVRGRQVEGEFLALPFDRFEFALGQPGLLPFRCRVIVVMDDVLNRYFRKEGHSPLVLAFSPRISNR